MKSKTNSIIGMAIINFLQREGAKDTWWYERFPILIVELLCLLAGIFAAPNRASALLLLVDLPRSLLFAEFGRAIRSGSARKVEVAEAMGIPAVEIRCQKDIDNAAKNQQLMIATTPVVALAMSVAASGGVGLSMAAGVGFAVSLVRYVMVEGYSPWRKWYRLQVPCRIKVPKVDQSAQLLDLLSSRHRDLVRIAEQVEALSGESIADTDVPTKLADEIVRKLLALKLMRIKAGIPPEAQHLAATTPYNSDVIAKAAEEVLREKAGSTGGTEQ
jgi:hypothetical protein